MCAILFKENVMSEGIKAQQTIRTALRSMHPHIVEVATMYNNTYPVASTLPEVVDAVTVAIPLRTFMVLAAIATQVLQEENAKKVPHEEPTL
jgi:hypothetical protein